MANKKQKKRFRVVGVPAGRNIVTYAANLEEAMNELNNEGYRFEVTQQPKGSIIVGHLPVELSPFPVPRPSSPAVEGEDEDPGLSPRAFELLRRFIRAVPPKTPVKDPAVVARLGTITMGFSQEELSAIAIEFEASAKAHDSHNNCGFPIVLRDAAELLRQSVRTQLS